MKIRRSILLFCGVVAVLAALLIWFAKKPTETGPRPTASSDAISEPLTDNSIKEDQQTTPFGVRTNKLDQVARTNSAALPVEDKGTQMREGLSTLNDVPIVFDGKVEDQFGSAVPEARIDASVRIYNGFKSTVERFVVASDAKGFFHIDHGKGEALGVVPSKQGYVLATPNTYFKYSYMYSDRFTPDPNNPAVIKMWKLQGAEPLTGIDQRYKFRYTGEPVNVDLLAGKIVPAGGDLKITVNRSAGIVSAQNMQDWSVRVEAMDGGLIKTDAMEARVTYALPESGYQPGDMFIMSTNAPHKWFGGVHQMYFVQSRGGQVYAKINISISINRNPEDDVWLEFRGAANTKGSRNFEADAPPNAKPLR